MAAQASPADLERRVALPPPVPPLPIVADGLGFRYPGSTVPALRDVTFRLDAGAVLLVVGPSGSGKSTLARAIAGLAASGHAGGAAWAGSLWVGNVEVTSEPRRWAARSLGVVFQDPASQLVMDRVADDVAFGLENRAWPLAAMRLRVPDALSAGGLGGFEARHSARLSGGEQQRVALAGALAPAPGVLVLDEPTASLDPVAAARLFDRLEELRASRTTTIVLVEHRADRAWPLADLVLALGADGRPVVAGPPDHVLRQFGDGLRREGIWLPGDRAAPVASAPRHGATVLARPVAPLPDRAPRRLPDARVASGVSALAMEAVRYSYQPGTAALRDVSLEVAAGERVALTGPNGSGKSTLLRLAVGLLRPTAGQVRLFGTDPRRMTPEARSRTVGFVHQDAELGFLAGTVAEEVALGLTSDEGRRCEDLMERLGLPLGRFGDRSPYRLSGGEQRRLSLATALVRRPRLLVLDEPTFGQDRRGHEALVGLLRELVDERTALLAASHDERFVREATDRRVELADGWIVDEAEVA